MADDIDDLLDEVETKYVEKKRNAVGVQKETKPRNKLDADISDILSDIPLDEDMDTMVTTSAENKRRSSNTKGTTGTGMKCYPVYLGGSKHPTGHGTSISQRTCDQLRCTACDFRVCLFDNYKWAPDTNYLFLRNNVPDFAKLKSKLSPSKSHRAYCCQCSWRSISDLTPLNDPELKWHCGKH